jgi:hypothetical protein
MKNIEILILFIAILLLFSCGKLRNKEQQVQQDNKQVQTTGEEKKPRDQYRIAENQKDSRNQIIDLMQGSSTFEIMFEGEGRFLAQITQVDGKLVSVLADRTGSFKDKKTIEIPATTAYLLEVKCTGYWSVYRE